MDKTRKRIIAMTQRTPLRDMLQYLHYDKGTGIYGLDNGNLGVLFELTPYIIAGDDVADKVLSVLNKHSIPDHSMASFCLWSGHDIRNYTEQNELLRMKRFKPTGSKEVDDVLKSLAEEQFSYISSHTDKPIERLFRTQVRDTRLFFSLVVKDQNAGKKKTLAAEDAIISLHGQIEEGFKAAGLSPRNVDPDMLRVVVGTMTNWAKDPSWKNPDVIYSEDDTIREQIFDIDSECVSHGSVFRLNEKYVSVLSADKMPSEVSLSQSYNYLIAAGAREAGIKNNVIITTNIFFDDQKRERNSIKKWRQWSTKQNVAPFNKINTDIPKIQESFDLLYDSCVAGGDRPCRVMFSMAIFGESEESVQRDAQAAITHFKGIRYTLREEILIGIPVFLMMLPLNADPNLSVVQLLARFKTCTTANAVRLIPACAEWKGLGRPVSAFIGRTGQLLPFNFFDNSTNYNALLMAESGSGKSVLSNRMIADILACGGRVIVVDQGYSYENSAELFGGKFITFNENSCPNLNPFPLIQDFDEEVDLLVGIVVAMAKIQPNTPDGIFQVASLRIILRNIWNEKGRSMIIDDIANHADQSDDKRICDISTLLYPFTTKGEYGKFYFNDSEPIDFNDSRMMVLELDDLKNKEHLSQVVVLQLILMANAYIYSKFHRGDSSWTLMLIDEAWKFVAKSSGSNDDNPVLDFVLTAYRQFRKHNAAMMLVTQSLNDVYQSEAGAAIAENAGNRIFMGQKAASISQMVTEGRVVLDDFWLEQLKSVETAKGVFSEMFFDTSLGKGVARLILSPYALLLFSTEAQDREDIRRYKLKGYTIVDSAKLVLHDRGVRGYMNPKIGKPRKIKSTIAAD